jgi:hypothetical protein
MKAVMLEVGVCGTAREICAWPAAVRSLITARHPAEAYRDRLLGPPQGIKNVLTFA